MKPVKLAILLLLFFTAVFDTTAQDLIEAKCYGGEQSLKAFINAEMLYPEKALKNYTEGTVVIYFVVDEKACVIEKTISLSVSPELDNEALRLFSKILWYPASLNSNPVSVKQSFPVKFDIKKYSRIVKRRGYSELKYPAEVIDTSNKIYDTGKLDKLPVPLFREKEMNFAKFIAKNTRYPEAAFKQNISGAVKLQFVIEPSGNVSNSIIVENVGGGCNEEAQRVIGMIKWKAGIKNNMAVRTMIQIGITFGSAGDSAFEYFPTHHGSGMQ
ncbi:MAG: energy transducer TonB [Bacteroidales bacterium]|nr:energy transducer TonB [Bacteroidales bacterium]